MKLLSDYIPNNAPPPGPPTKAAIQEIADSLKAYGTDTLGPPPGMMG